MEVARAPEPFDRQDLVAFMHHREAEAAVDAPPVHEDGAGAALAVVATLLRAGQADMLSKGIEQRGADVEIEVVDCSVDAETGQARSCL